MPKSTLMDLINQSLLQKVRYLRHGIPSVHLSDHTAGFYQWDWSHDLHMGMLTNIYQVNAGTVDLPGISADSLTSSCLPRVYRPFHICPLSSSLLNIMLYRNVECGFLNLNEQDGAKGIEIKELTLSGGFSVFKPFLNQKVNKSSWPKQPYPHDTYHAFHRCFSLVHKWNSRFFKENVTTVLH